MIKDHVYYELFASVKSPNPDEVGYWVDLLADPKGNIIKFWDGNIRKWVKLTDASSEYAVAPYIGTNGNWFVENRDTGVPASGKTPYIGDNMNWFVFDPITNQYVDTGVISKGESAYDIAVRYGFVGTEEEWLQYLRQPAEDAAAEAEAVLQNYLGIIEDNELVTAAALNDLNTRLLRLKEELDDARVNDMWDSIYSIQQELVTIGVRLNAALTAARIHSGVGISVVTETNGDITIHSSVDDEIFVVVTELPEVGQKNKVYLLPHEDGEEHNQFEEYIWVGVSTTHPNGYERIGTIDIDLSIYYTKDEVNQIIEENELVTSSALNDLNQRVEAYKFVKVIDNTTIAISSWYLNNDSYETTVIDDRLTENSIVTVWASDDTTEEILSNAEMHQNIVVIVDNATKVFILRAVNIPEGDVNINYTII